VKEIRVSYIQYEKHSAWEAFKKVWKESQCNTSDHRVSVDTLALEVSDNWWPQSGTLHRINTTHVASSNSHPIVVFLTHMNYNLIITKGFSYPHSEKNGIVQNGCTFWVVPKLLMKESFICFKWMETFKMINKDRNT